MRKGLVIFLVGFAGVGGAIDLNKNLIAPTAIMLIGLLMILVGMWKESNEKEADRNRDRITDRDVNRPYFLCK